MALLIKTVGLDVQVATVSDDAVLYYSHGMVGKAVVWERCGRTSVEDELRADNARLRNIMLKMYTEIQNG